jgi:GMP synthase PP-ATPase subunit
MALNPIYSRLDKEIIEQKKKMIINEIREIAKALYEVN